MVEGMIAVLQDLRDEFGGRISSINLYDPNVCVSPRDKAKPWSFVEQPGDIFRHKLNTSIAGHKVGLLANDSFIVAEVPATCAGCSSINREDVVMALQRKDVKVSGFPSLPIWSSQSENDLMLLLSSDALKNTLKTIQLGAKESIHIYKNSLTIYLQRTSSKEIALAVEAVCSLAGHLKENVVADRKVLKTSKLPVRFEDLAKLIPKWAESDDAKRSKIIDDATTASLNKFVATVEPRLQAVNDYLDLFKNSPPSEVAVALGTLAECCMEAKIELRNRARANK